MLHRLLVAAILVAAFAPAALAAATCELAGTSWRLVKILSMDDRVYEPDDTSKYTLVLGVDGTAAMFADCNSGTGAWTSASASQLRFGPIAATKALPAGFAVGEIHGAVPVGSQLHDGERALIPGYYGRRFDRRVRAY